MLSVALRMSGRGRQPGQRRAERVIDADAQWQKVEPFSTFDAFPVISQAKSAFQWCCGDAGGAQVTWERCKVYGPVFSQVYSIVDYCSGLPDEAAERQSAFFDNLARVWMAAAESLPLTAPFFATAHHCRGDRTRSKWIAQKASRSCLVFTAGAAVCTCAGPAVASASKLAMVGAAAAGTVAGITADAFLVARPRVPRPLSPGQRFDWAAMRLLDAMRAMAGFDLVLVFWPEHAGEVSIWVEPISVGDAARLVVGKKTSAEDASVMGALDHIPSGVDHTFVMWKTNKGHLFVSERLHDGRVLVEDLHRGTMLPFLKGRAMPIEDLAHRHGAGGGPPGHGTGAAAGGVSPAAVAAAKAPAEAAKLISAGKAKLFSERMLPNGPTVAHCEELAKAQSVAGYDLLQANCQHYVQDFWKFAVGHGLGMPNQDFLNLFQIFGTPAHGAKIHDPGILGNAGFSLRSAGIPRIVLDGALLKLPVVPSTTPSQLDQEVVEDASPAECTTTGNAESAVSPREGTWV